MLLVEDDEADRLFFGRALRTAGFGWRLATAVDGREAVDYLSGVGRFADRSAHPAATHVLLDLKLPHLSGLEVLAWIRSQPERRELPVIVLSSSQEESDIRRAKTLGVDAYEVKPVELSALVQTVRDIGARWGIQAPPA